MFQGCWLRVLFSISSFLLFHFFSIPFFVPREYIRQLFWDRVKWKMVESAREASGSVRLGDGNTKSVWWNDQVKVADKRKEGAWK